MYEHYKFQLEPLPYNYDALEPWIDSQTMMLHHDRHLRTYVENLNAALEGYVQYQGLTLQQLLVYPLNLPPKELSKVRNNAGGVLNHQLYFTMMRPGGSSSPCPRTRSALERTFGSLEAFQDIFIQTALGQFGSGYAWLVCDPQGRLKVLPTANQDTTLPMNLYPILGVDVWEHAYYLKYKNKRADYLENWMQIVNWDVVERYYNAYAK